MRYLLTLEPAHTGEGRTLYASTRAGSMARACERFRERFPDIEWHRADVTLASEHKHMAMPLGSHEEESE